MIACFVGCALFQSHQSPAPPQGTRTALPQETMPAPPQTLRVTRLRPRIRSTSIRARPVLVSKPSQPRLNQPPQPSPAPLVTLENSDDAKANAQRLLNRATTEMTHIDRAGLAESTASTYQQANELINAAQRAMADQDYLAASSLAQKASALTSQLPSQK